MMYVLGWLLMLGGGVVFFGGGLGLLGGGVGTALISLGVMLAAVGAVVQAIKELGETVKSEAAKDREAYKTGTESLWKQLDAVRTSMVQASSPPVPVFASAAADDGPVSAVTGMGYCQGCGRLRGLGTTRCVYCGDTQPALEQAPVARA